MVLIFRFSFQPETERFPSFASNPKAILSLNFVQASFKKSLFLIAALPRITFSTPVFLRPLEFGADIAMHSTTKYLSGHNQIIGGAILTNDEKIFDKMKFIQKTIGAVPSPYDCFLTMLGLRTLHLRMKKHQENAQSIAEFLESHTKVSRVSYPGLPSDPGHAIAKEQMTGYSGMISFELSGGIPAGKHVMNNVGGMLGAC